MTFVAPAEVSFVADLKALCDPVMETVHGDGQAHVWRDAAPNTPSPGEPLPYVIIDDDALPSTPLAFGDARTTWMRRVAVVNLFQDLSAEDPTLIQTLLRVLDGGKLTAPRRRAFCQFVVRTIEPEGEQQVVHHVIQVRADTRH